MKKELHISKDLAMPIDSATQKIAWLGTTGSGKTYGASKFAEELWDNHAQFVVIDPVGVWYGLRLSKDGKKPSHIDIPIFGGLHGDVPLEPTGGELMANLIVDKGLSCIIDVSQFESDADKARFASAFASRLYFRKKSSPSAIHLFLEECQEFVPQNPQRGEEKMLHEFIRMQKLGRNFGIGSSYITQRPQEVNKKALNMAQNLFVFRTTGTHERKAIEVWIQDKDLDQNIANDLPKIPTGNCHIWSPEFLKVSKMIRISEKKTFNASATPEVGNVAKSRELAPIDLEKVRKEMSATIEKAKADDPKELRKQIAELKKNPAKVFDTAFIADPKAITKAVKEAIDENNKAWELKVFELNGQYLDQVSNWINIIQEIGKAMNKFKIELPKSSKPKAMPIQFPKSPIDQIRNMEIDARNNRVNVPMTFQNDGLVSAPELKVINAVAWLASIGQTVVSKEAVAMVAGYRPTSGGFANICGKLRAGGYVEYPSGNMISLTEKGDAMSTEMEPPQSVEEIHGKIFSVLSIPEQKVLKPLISAYPHSISNERLAEESGYAPTSGGFANLKGRLRTLGLISYPQPNHSKAEDLLFPNI